MTVEQRPQQGCAMHADVRPQRKHGVPLSGANQVPKDGLEREEPLLEPRALRRRHRSQELDHPAGLLRRAPADPQDAAESTRESKDISLETRESVC
jgi:hypothetical protein